MFLHRRTSSGRSIVTIICTGITLFHHRVDGLPVLVKDAIPIPTVTLRSDDARWFNSSDNTAVSTLVVRSSLPSNDVVHDRVFIPAIVSIGVLVVICIICCYQLFVNRTTIHSRRAIRPIGDGYNRPPILHSQNALGRQGGDHAARPLSRGLSKISRKSPPSILSSVPGSPSVQSDTPGFHHHLQQQRLQQQLQQLQQQQQDPYRQYMAAHDHGYPQQQQYTPHPSVAGSVVHRGEGVQPQSLHGVQTHAIRAVGPDPTGVARAPGVAQPAQPPFPNAAVQRAVASRQTSMNASGWEQYRAQQQQQNLQQQRQEQQQQQQPDPRISHTLSAQTSSTRATSDILSYMTPPEARRPPSNQSQPPPNQNQDYFNSRPAQGGVPIIPSQTTPPSGDSSTHGIIARSAPANNTPMSGNPFSPPGSTHATHGYTHARVQPPSYAENENVQGKVISTSHSEKNG